MSVGGSLQGWEGITSVLKHHLANFPREQGDGDEEVCCCMLLVFDLMKTELVAPPTYVTIFGRGGLLLPIMRVSVI